MNEALPTSSQLTFWDTPKCISSQEFQAGHSPLALRDTQPTNPSGPRPVRALHSAQPGKRKAARSAATNLSRIRSRLESLLASSVGTSGSPTGDISTPSCTASSASAALPEGVDLGWLESSFPLAQGVKGRIPLLRGFGNAIVPPLAAEFIGACFDVITRPANPQKPCGGGEE